METQTEALVKVQPCDAALRERLLALVNTDGISRGEIARRSNINPAIISQYLAEPGNQYPGDTAKYERRLRAWLDRREIELLAGVATMKSSVAMQLQSFAATVRRRRIMGRVIGEAGIGKTRGCAWLGAQDANALVYFVTRESGTTESVRGAMFRRFGIRGAKSYGHSNVDKYAELIKRLRGADVTFVFDQAHRLSQGALHFLCEVWNDTRHGMLFVGTDRLLDVTTRDEQIASRMLYTRGLVVDEESARELITHQIKALLPDINGELKAVTNLCFNLSEGRKFRDVEMRLNDMADRAESKVNAGKNWRDLFAQAADGQFVATEE